MSQKAIFWIVKPCSLVEIYRRFRGTYRLHLLDRIFYETLIPEKVMSESDFALNGSLGRYSYAVSDYSGDGDSDSASFDRFEMDVGISITSSFNHSSTSNSSVGNFVNNSSLLPDGDTYPSLYEVPTGVTAVLSLFYGSISVTAVVGNSLVMWIVATSPRMQNVTNCFIANLALADIVIGLFAIPFQFQAALLQRWNLPYFMCPFCPFVQVLSVNVSVFTLTAIAVDRHRAILEPFSASPSKMCAKLVIAGIWVISAALAAPMAFALWIDMIEDPWGHIKPFCYNVNLSDYAMLCYRVVLLVLQYLTPLCIISCVYIRMALTLWGSKTPGNAQSSRDEALMKNKKKVIKMLVIVVALFALCWLPLQTYNVLQDICPEINGYRYINIIWFCCDWLAMSNSCYNPFIYGIYNEKFKREFRLRFGLCSRRCAPTGNGSSLTRDLSEMEKMSVRCDNSFRFHTTCPPPGRKETYRCLPAQQTRTEPLSDDEKY